MRILQKTKKKKNPILTLQTGYLPTFSFVSHQIVLSFSMTWVIQVTLANIIDEDQGRHKT